MGQLLVGQCVWMEMTMRWIGGRPKSRAGSTSIFGYNSTIVHGALRADAQQRALDARILTAHHAFAAESHVRGTTSSGVGDNDWRCVRLGRCYTMLQQMDWLDTI